MLSIVVVNYNTFDFTSLCLQSIYAFVTGISFEVILVDNGSSEAIPAAFTSLFPDIILVRSERNLGFAGGVNEGVKRSSGEYILLLNSDAELTSYGIERCLDRLRADEKVGVLSCKTQFRNGQLQHIANDFPSITKELCELLRLHRFAPRIFRLNGYYFDHLSEREVDWVWGTFFLMPRHVLSIFPNGALPDTFFMYFEDVLWCYEMKRYGLKVLYYPNYSVIHHSGGSSSEAFASERKLQLLIENEKLFLSQTRGRVYMIAVYFLRALKFLSLRKREFINLSGRYLRAALW